MSSRLQRQYIRSECNAKTAVFSAKPCMGWHQLGIPQKGPPLERQKKTTKWPFAIREFLENAHFRPVLRLQSNNSSLTRNTPSRLQKQYIRSECSAKTAVFRAKTGMDWYHLGIPHQGPPLERQKKATKWPFLIRGFLENAHFRPALRLQSNIFNAKIRLLAHMIARTRQYATRKTAVLRAKHGPTCARRETFQGSPP
jgi:hypothetical protein